MGTAEQPPLRIGNEERERAARALGEHYAAGRLDAREFEERTGLAYAARTAADLDALFVDLPRPPAPQHHAPPSLDRAPGGYPGIVDAAAPYGREPGTGRPYSDKSKILAGVLQLVFPIGVGRFYSGHVGMGIAQLLVTILTLGLGAVWAFIDGIVILAGRPIDRDGRLLRG